ncbi:MFS transporter [Methylophilus luteus]|uniref:MFS transporter n=1 Tax=Methylophilus luteus TaxID=640108 RepID=A0ABW3F7S8_9PROT
MLPIYLLSTAGFTILTTEFLIVGLLPSIARDLNVSISTMGLLVTLFAFTVAAFGPFLTSFFSKYERKMLFVVILTMFGFANTLAAIAPNFGVMAFARVIPAVALPVYWALASESSVNLTGSKKAGNALSILTFGIVCATIFGIPIGALLSDAFGWRVAFGILAALAFSKAIMLQMYMPIMKITSKKIPFLEQLSYLRDPLVLGHVVLSILIFTAMFTTYTYLADMLERLAGFDGSLVGWTLMAFGGIGLIGNWLGGKAVDWNPLWASLLFSILLCLGMLFVVPSFDVLWGMPITLGIWGIAQAAQFVVNHARLMKAVPQAPAFAASLNISGANLGIGVGAIIGGKVIDNFGIENLGFTGAFIIGCSILFTLGLIRIDKRI